jgi:Rieske Fe-S protein
LCGLTIGLVAPGALAACTVTPVAATTISSLPKGTVVGQVRDVPVGGGVLETVNNEVLVLLAAPSAGVIKAYDPTCPHAGATVGTPVNGVITCPAHGSQFDPATGAVERGPAPKGLTMVPVTIKGGNIILT